RELYDHDADPGEITNLAARSEHASTIAQLAALIEARGRAPREAAPGERGALRPRLCAGGDVQPVARVDAHRLAAGADGRLAERRSAAAVAGAAAAGALRRARRAHALARQGLPLARGLPLGRAGGAPGGGGGARPERGRGVTERPRGEGARWSPRPARRPPRAPRFAAHRGARLAPVLHGPRLR